MPGRWGSVGRQGYLRLIVYIYRYMYISIGRKKWQFRTYVDPAGMMWMEKNRSYDDDDDDGS